MASDNGLSSKFTSGLAEHLTGINVYEFCRISASRVAQTALPHIGKIELVSAESFAKLYNELYISSFPLRPERERSDLIIDRLKKELAGEREQLAPYRIIGILDHDGKAIGAAQFSVLLLLGQRYAVPYLQYLYVRRENRRQDMAEVLHTMTLAVSTADAKKNGDREVPFKLFETEPPGHGENEAHRAVATQRAIIHTKAGGVAIMLCRENDSALISPHVQPGLEDHDPPLSLVWVIRPSPAMPEHSVDIDEIGPSLIAAYYQSLRDEGFPEANIQLAEQMVAQRSTGCKFVSMSLMDVVLPGEDHTMLESKHRLDLGIPDESIASDT